MPITPTSPPLAYTTTGLAGAPWVVLVTGLGSVQVAWLLQVRALALRFRVLTFDHRGLGDSPPAPGAMDIWAYAADLERVLDAAGIEAAHFAGLSFGGRVLQALALTAPHRVRSLVLSGTACGGFGSSPGAASLHRAPLADPEAETARWEEEILPLLFGARYRTRYPERMRHLARWRARHPSDASSVDTQWAASACFDVCARLSEIRCPTLVLHGAEDALSPVTNAHRLAAGIPNADLQVLEGVGHSPNAEDPEAFNAALLAFFGAQA